jgi:hypothetical protein
MPFNEEQTIPPDHIRDYYAAFKLPDENYSVSEELKEFENKVFEAKRLLAKLEGIGKEFYLNLRTNQTSFQKTSDDFVDANWVLDSALSFFKELGEKKIAVMLLERIVKPLALLFEK